MTLDLALVELLPVLASILVVCWWAYLEDNS